MKLTRKSLRDIKDACRSLANSIRDNHDYTIKNSVKRTIEDLFEAADRLDALFFRETCDSDNEPDMKDFMQAAKLIDLKNMNIDVSVMESEKGTADGSGTQS